jgi:hypothetical protein
LICSVKSPLKNMGEKFLFSFNSFHSILELSGMWLSLLQDHSPFKGRYRVSHLYTISTSLLTQGIIYARCPTNIC